MEGSCTFFKGRSCWIYLAASEGREMTGKKTEDRRQETGEKQHRSSKEDQGIGVHQSLLASSLNATSVSLLGMISLGDPTIR